MPVVGRLDQYASMLATEFDDYSMSENLLTYSEQFDDASWTKNNGSISANSISAPDRTTTADAVIENTTATAYHSFAKTITKTASSITYTFSSFAQSKGGRRIGLRLSSGGGGAVSTFDAVSGTITTVAGVYGTGFSNASSSITQYPNNWYRIVLTVTSDTTTSLSSQFYLDNGSTTTYTGDGTSGAYIWGAQLEQGSVATDYTPTTTTAISRVLASTTNTNITGLGTYYSSGFDENVGFTTFLSANIFPPYDLVYDEFGGTLFGPGQGRYMRQNTDKSVIVYNEIDEIGLMPSYVISPSTTSVNEGSSVIFNVISTNVESGTTLYYDITGSVGIASTDFTNNSLSGSLVISGTFDTGFGSTTLTLANDATTEGTETFNMNLRTGSISGPIVTTSPTVTVGDTSLTSPPTATVTSNTSSVNEGSTVTFTVNTTNFTSGTLYWTLSTTIGTINTSDFTGAAVSGSFNITSSTGSVALTLANDATTEGNEVFQLEVRTDSISGTIIGTSNLVTINDTSLTPSATPTPSTSSVNEGSGVTFNITSNQLSTTLYWTLSTISGTINTSDFTGAAVSGSFSTDGTGAGSVALTLANDVTTEGTESFQLQVRTGSTSGTIIGTSTTVTINDTSVNVGYTVTSGTKAPVFGANAASPHPPTGWTNQFNSSVDDANLQIPTLPFNFFINNTAFTAVFLGSNSYLTFGSGSNEYSGLSAAVPAIPKMMFGAADNSYQRVSTFVSGTDYVRVRYEGNGSTSGTAGAPGIVAEITLFNPSKFSGNNNVIEMLVGVHNRTGGVSNISNASTAYATYTVSANQSFVFVGNSTGTSWTINTGSFVSGTGY